MAITTCIPTSFKQGMLAGTYVVASDTFKIALYTSSASLDASTTAYTASGECTGTNYSAGGISLSGASVFTDTTTVGVTFSNPTFTNITVSGIQGLMIYDSSKINGAVLIYNFTGSTSVTTSNYTLLFPAATTAAGLLKFL